MVHQGLLKTVAESEYPAEFLVARLLGKKGALFRDWEPLITSSDAAESLRNSPFYPYLKSHALPDIWRFLRNEYLWVYKRMNGRLRAFFSSYFAYHEINTLIICCRYLYGSNDVALISQELKSSLLSNEIQQTLTGGQDFSFLLKDIEVILCKGSELFAGLAERFEAKGIAGLELFVRDRFFAAAISQKQPLLLKSFLQYLVDMNNCLSLAKSLRWQIKTEPPLTPGGTVPLDLFKRAYFRKDLVPVLRFLRLKDPESGSSGLHKLENSLLCHLTGKLKIWARQRTVVGDILFYLWEQYRYTRNISMILNTVLLDDEPVRESIVA